MGGSLTYLHAGPRRRAITIKPVETSGCEILTFYNGDWEDLRRQLGIPNLDFEPWAADIPRISFLSVSMVLVTSSVHFVSNMVQYFLSLD